MSRVKVFEQAAMSEDRSSYPLLRNCSIRLPGQPSSESRITLLIAAFLLPLQNLITQG